MRWTQGALWRHHDFVRLWQADTISQVGASVTGLAFPLTAALLLNAGAFQVGVLIAVTHLPALLFGLVAGAWIDRRPRRPVMIAADIGRAFLLILIPLAYFFDRLSMPLLSVVGFAAGTLTIFFDIAYMALLPRLVAQDQLVEANSKLEATFSASQVIGPGLAGTLIALLTAPIAILVDALSFVVSALLLSRIRVEEPAHDPEVEHPSLRSSISEGLRTVQNDRVLRAMLGCSTVNSLFGYLFFSVYVLFMVQNLGLGSTAIGFVFATGGVGALIGAMLSGRVAQRYGNGWAQIIGQAGYAITGLLVPVAVLFKQAALPLVVASEFSQWLFLMIFIVNTTSLRQSRTPDELMARVNSTFVFVARGMRPVGSLLGGLLGVMIGLPMTLVVGEIGLFVALAWLVLSPVRQVRTLDGEQLESTAAGFLAVAALEQAG